MGRTMGGALLCALALCACAGEPDETQAIQRVPETVALGELPEPRSSTVPLFAPPTTPPTTVPDDDEVEVEPITGQVGEVVTGNRLLLVGDAGMATLTPRFDGVGCAVLSKLGWQVELEAEPGRFVSFADEVIDEVVIDSGPRWDVVGLMFGHLVEASVEEFRADLERVVDRLSPRPILLYTVTQDGDETATQVNTVIREVGSDRPNVVVVDWGAAVAFEKLLDLTDDAHLPNAEGMGRIALLTAAALGEPANGGDGACLESRFVDDSAIVIDS